MGRPLRVVVVRGPSMVPALRDGDRLVVRLGALRRTPAVGRVVVVRLPDRPLSIKRLRSIDSDGRIHVEGDNEYASTDSRSLGSLSASAVEGVALVRLWPRPGRIPRPR